MKERRKRTVFAVLSKTDYPLANYAAELAQKMNLNLVLYVEKAEELDNMWDIYHALTKKFDIKIKISEKRANMFSWFLSIHEIALSEYAEVVVMSLDQEKVGFFGETLWHKAQKIIVPILLVPSNTEFIDFKKIIISADSSMKIQKTGIVTKWARCFDSDIHIFKENVEDAQEQKIIDIVSRNISNILKENHLRFSITKAKNTKNFAKHLCKYSAKNGDLLVVEVDPGKINQDTKIQIETLLNHNKPVLLKKTKQIGFVKGFN